MGKWVLTFVLVLLYATVLILVGLLFNVWVEVAVLVMTFIPYWLLMRKVLH